MRLLLLSNEYRPVQGGIATYCQSIIQALHEAGCQVQVIAAAKQGISPKYDDTQPYPIKRTSEHAFTAVRHWTRWQAVESQIGRQRPDWLWASDWRTGLIIAAASQKHKIPFMVSAFGSELLSATLNPVSLRLAEAVFRRATTILPISDYTSSLLQHFDTGNRPIVKVMPGTSQVDSSKGAEQGLSVRQQHAIGSRPLILTLARLVARKGHDTIIRALPIVRGSIPEFRYLIAGDGAARQNLENLAASLGLSEHIIFAGAIPEAEKQAYYEACDVYALLNRQAGADVEGFGITLLEASACGKPVVAGKQGGTSDAVIDGVTGILVPSTGIEATAQALIKLLNNHQVARQMGARGRSYVEAYANWPRAAAQILEIMTPQDIAHDS